MTETLLARIVDSGIALAVLVWIVNTGQKQMEKLYSDHYTMTQKLIDSLMERNKQLGETLITCISAATQPYKDRS